MFWIICLLVFIGVLIALGVAMSRARRSSGLSDDNRDALQKGSAQAYGRRMQGGGGGFGGGPGA